MLHSVMRSQRITALVLAVATGLAISAGCKTNSPPAAAQADGLKPGANDARIAFIAARLLEGYHYQQRPLDHDLSAKFFDGYINALDPRHETFLQADLDEFTAVRTNLDVLTVGGNSKAELAPAFSIYQRFVERSIQHSAYVNDLLQHEKFKFATDEKIAVDRRHDPFPKTLDEAKQLWRQRLRYEYLLEKLAREIHETNGVFNIKFPADAHTNITAMLEKRYNWNLHMTTNWSSDTVLETYLNYGLAHAYDPHSDYFGPQKAADFSIDMNLALFGIGAQLSEDYGFCTIRELLPGGPAMKSKQLKPDDRIVAVAQGDKPPVDVVNMDLGKVVQQIRGPKGTEVRLTVIPAEDRGARRVVALIRDEIKLEDKEAKAQLIEFPDGQRLGIIDLPSFYAPVNDGSGARTTPKYTSVDVTKLLERLKKEKVQGVILDLRSNPGGSLEEAVRFTGLFIKDGPVVQARDSASHITIDSDPDPNIVYGGPLVVLLNRFSASASEIAAAALQDYGRAIVVGDVSTHGKGTVQQLQQLRPFVWPANSNATNDPGMLKITKGKFYRVSGASTQLKGVASDIVLPDILNHSSTIGEEALENALAWDTIQPARYDKLNLVEPFLAELQSRSQTRVATNQEFAYIKQDIELFKKNQADKTASLNEREVIADRERDTLKNRDREKERDVRPLPAVKIYEITVKNSDDAELPAPKSWFATNIVTAIVPTNWPAGTISISLTNAFAGGSTSYLGTLPTLPAAATNLVTDARLTDNSTNCATIKATINKSVPQDPVLEEGENILRDYISILGKNGMLTLPH